MSRVPDFFGPAQAIATNAAQTVQSRITDATNTANQLRTSALSALDALSNATFIVNEDPPEIPNLDDLVLAVTTPTGAGLKSFGSVTPPSAGTAPTPEDYTMPTVVFGDFVPSISGLIIPEAPSAGTFTLPTKPTTPTITYPAAPAEVIPTLDGLVAVNVPTFVFPTLPAWDGVLPAFEGDKPSNVFNWTEPTYAPTVIGDAVTAIKGIFSGGHGLPPAVEDAIFNRMSDREDTVVARAVSEAMDEYSARGFTNPPGMLSSRVDAIRQEGMLRKQGANRELTIKFAEWEIENYRLAIQQGIAAEGVYANIWLNGVARTFEAQKFQIEAAITLYNAAVNVFNAKMLGYQTQASVYKTRIDAALAELEVYKAQIEGEKLKTEMNKVQVDAYEAKIRAALGIIEIYKAKMEGAKIQADVAKLAIEGFKAEVDAYGAQVAADKNKFDAYKARIEGEGAKAQIIESEARAFAAKIQGKAAQVQAYKAEAEVTIEKNRAAIQAFIAEVEKDKATMQYQLSGIQANVAGFNADVSRFAAEAGLQSDIAKINVAGYEATGKVQVAYYQAQVAAYAQRVEQMLREAALTIESMKTVASVSATLAAGAMAGINASAQISGQGNVNAVGQLSGSDSFAINYQVQSEGSPPIVLP